MPRSAVQESGLLGAGPSLLPSPGQGGHPNWGLGTPGSHCPFSLIWLGDLGGGGAQGHSRGWRQFSGIVGLRGPFRDANSPCPGLCDPLERFLGAWNWWEAMVCSSPAAPQRTASWVSPFCASNPGPPPHLPSLPFLCLQGPQPFTLLLGSLTVPWPWGGSQVFRHSTR